MDRLFVAAWPDAATTAGLEALPRPVETDVHWVPAENWHITLRFVGDGSVDDLAAALSTVSLPRATAALGPAVSTLGPQVVIPVTGVDRLAEQVRTTDAVGETSDRPFRGHLTIARTKRGARSAVIGHPFTAAFEVREIAIVASTLTPDGARYDTVATFPTTA